MSLQHRFTISFAGRENDRLIAFTGNENVWDLYRFNVTIGVEGNLELANLLRQPAHLMIQTADGKTLRHIHGIITAAAFQAETRNKRFRIYELAIEPELALLKRRVLCRIFQQQDVKSIIQSVIESSGIESDRYRFNLQGASEPRVYCVQYNESDWDFIRRLCEEEGWFHYFEHDAEKHTLVFTNHRQGCGVLEPKAVPFHESSSQSSREAHFFQFNAIRSLAVDAWHLTDYAYTKPNLELVSAIPGDKSGLESYQYPGQLVESDANERAARRWADAERAAKNQHFGHSDHALLLPGYEFSLAGENLSGVAGDYLLIAIDHSGEQPQALEEESTQGPTRYSNRVIAVPAIMTYRNTETQAKPTIAGHQTARVVGPEGEKIYTDEFGRVKVRFHWDKLSPADDEHASCWLRVMQSWADGGYGSFILPRVGQEVVVQFENGDPDRPLVTGTVYNGVNRAALDLPAQKTQTLLRTQLSGEDGYHEIRIEDQADKAGIFVESGKDWTRRVKNDSKTFIGNEHHLVIKKDQIEQVDGDKYQSVKGSVAQKYEKTLSLDVGADLQIQTTDTSAIEAANELHFKSGKTIIIEDGAEITIKVGGNFLKIDSSGVTVVGSKIKLNSGGSAGNGKAVKVIKSKAAKVVEPANAHN